MKKPTRAERRAMIEKGKNIAIIGLCLCCVFFLFSIWNLYKGQVTRGQAFWETKGVSADDSAKATDAAINFRDLTEPQLIMVGQASTRAVLKEDSELYVRAVTAINNVIKNVYNSRAEAFVATERDLWQNVISNGIVYAKFPCMMDTTFEKHFTSSGEDGMTSNIKSYEDITIVPHGSADNGVTVFVQDKSTRQTYKVDVNSSAKEIRSIIDGCKDKKNNKFVFAHELNLDARKDEGTGNPPVVLDSMFLIPMEKTASEHILTDVPDEYLKGMEFSHANEFTGELLTLFGYNPNTVRRYEKNDGTVLFVGDTGSLSLHSDGRIEQKALGESAGLPFVAQEKHSADPREIMSGLTVIIDSVFDICGMDADCGLRITRMPDVESDDETRLEMEYFNHGRKIMVGQEPAVVVTLKGGKVSDIKITVKNIKTTGEITMCQEAFGAIDAFCEKNPQCKTISRGELVYKAFEDGKSTSAVWQIQGE